MNANVPQSAWDYAGQYLEAADDMTPEEASAAIYLVLEWLDARRLLRPTGQWWLTTRTSKRMRQVGLFREDVSPEAATFLDAYYETWLNRSGIFISLIPGSDVSAREALSDFWGEHTGAKPEKQRREFERLFAEATDFDLCNGVFVLIGDRYHHCIAADQSSDAVRVVRLTWHASGIIGNGGFEYLFSDDVPGDPGFQLTLAGFKTLGIERAVSAFQEALSLFPKSRLPRNIEKRMQIYKATSEAIRDSINGKFCDAIQDEIEHRLADYLRTHRAELDCWTADKSIDSK